MKCIKKAGSAWIKDNMFKYNKVDGGAYFALYLVIPVIVSYISLQVAKQSLEITYAFLSILITALNCIYDAYNRWNRESKSIVNLKLTVMGICLAGVSAYCFYVIVGNLLEWTEIKYFNGIFMYTI